MEKIILGEWDGLPIWRRKTSGEILAEELAKETWKKNYEPEPNEVNEAAARGEIDTNVTYPI